MLEQRHVNERTPGRVVVVGRVSSFITRSPRAIEFPSRIISLSLSLFHSLSGVVVNFKPRWVLASARASVSERVCERVRKRVITARFFLKVHRESRVIAEVERKRQERI